MKWFTALMEHLFAREGRIKVQPKKSTRESTSDRSSNAPEGPIGAVGTHRGVAVVAQVGERQQSFVFSLSSGGSGGVLVTGYDGIRFVARHYPARRDCWDRVSASAPKSWDEFEEIITIIEQSPRAIPASTPHAA